MKWMFIIGLAALPFCVTAQKLSGGINLQLSFPQGQYKAVDNSTGIGARIDFHFKPSPTVPLSIGADIGFLLVGSRRETFSGYSGLGFYEEYQVNATSNVVSLMLDVRIDPTKQGALVRPYADLKFGWNDFYSSVTVERVDNYYGNAPVNSNSSKARWANAYGGSAGIAIRLDKKASVYLDLKTTYLQGAKTKYLTDPTINNNGTVSFTEKESETSMLIPQVGVRLNFL
jgi:hypothetical protein